MKTSSFSAVRRSAALGLTLVAASAALIPATVLAHENHGKPKFGGIVAEGGAYELELVLQAKQVVLHLTDHGKLIDVKGGTAKLTLLSGTTKSEANLSAAGNKFEATGDFPTAKGTKVVAVVTLPGKKAVTARFEVK